MRISLVLPCYNPPVQWEQNVVFHYRAFCDVIQEEPELILVLDGCGELVSEKSMDYLRREIREVKIISYSINKGKGYALRQGVAAATGELIIYTDIDFPYDMDSMKKVYDALNKEECDVAVGIKDETYYRQVPRARRAISMFLRMLTGVFLSLPITDTQCGLKGFSKKVSGVFLATTIDRYLFDLEFVRNCYKTRRFVVRAIPVKLSNDVHFRKMNYRILIPEMINFILLLIGKRK